MELFDLYDIKGHKTGKTIQRGKPIPNDLYHLVVHVIIKNSKGELLVQKRSLLKETHPGLWAFTAGSATTGETSIEAAQRELGEEIGLHLEKEQFLFHKRVIKDCFFDDIWFVYSEVDINQLEYQVEEVSEAAFMTIDGIKDMVSKGTFYNYEDDYFMEVFKI